MPIGVPHYRFDEIDSTNSRALEYANDPALDGAVFQALVQTAGRGQYGRVWQAEPGEAILMSLLLFPPPGLCRPVLLTALAAVAVCGTIAEITGLPARIKWPNDVLIGGRKVCGILIESRLNRDRELAVVCGIGLNLNQSAEQLISRDLPAATSLRIETSDTTHDLETSTAALLAQLAVEYERLRTGDVESLEATWRSLMRLDGKRVRAAFADGSGVEGQIVSMEFDAIRLLDSCGIERRLKPETVRQIAEI